MNNTLKVLKFFVEHKNCSYSIRKIGELLKMSYKLVYKEVLTLQKEGVISVNIAGRAKMCSFNYKFSSRIVEVEEERKKELFKNKDVKLVYDRLMDVKQSLFILLIFGSYADKSCTKNSDIDICIITDDKSISKKMNEILEVTPIRVHMNEFTTKEFSSMLLTKKENIAHEIMKNNIILYGIENFYEMVRNAQ